MQPTLDTEHMTHATESIPQIAQSTELAPPVATSNPKSTACLTPEQLKALPTVQATQLIALPTVHATQLIALPIPEPIQDNTQPPHPYPRMT
jgi:hypothetical protein